MSGYGNLIGLAYVDGKVDCYSCVRNYYRQVWDLYLPNFARPDRFWDDPDLDLYSRYRDCGFEVVIDEPYKIGDAVLMPLLSSINSHAAVVVDHNRILHHLPNQLSTVDPIRPKWGSRVTVHLRHPEVRPEPPEQVHLHEVIHADILRNPELQAKIDEVLEQRSGEMRDPDEQS